MQIQGPKKGCKSDIINKPRDNYSLHDCLAYNELSDQQMWSRLSHREPSEKLYKRSLSRRAENINRL